MENIELDLTIDNIGECKIDSPLLTKSPSTDFAFVADDKKVLYNVVHSANGPVGRENPTSFEKAGPRRKIFFDPGRARVAIITCGGLCPGTNDVIRSLVMESHYRYGVQSIIGIRYGFLGLNPGTDYQPVPLTPEYVRDIHKMGGTILGSSRGGTDDMESIVDSLERQYINILYVIGGDGSLRAAHDIAVIARRRRLKLSVIGIPKTIDNDVSYIQRTFGFETAFSRAVDSIYAAHIEAEGTPNGIGLVKLMGRHSGFIAASSALAMNDVNFVLIPEVPFELDGPNGFFHHLEQRLARRGHAVICVAEGAGQDILVKDPGKQGRDASGNIKLADIGLYLRDAISEYFKGKNIPVSVKYIDPSYLIRSAPANPNDSFFCALLGQYAVHAGMAGKTDMIVGQWNNIFTHVPIGVVTSKRNQINPHSRLWFNVLEATGQPADMRNG